MPTADLPVAFTLKPPSLFVDIFFPMDYSDTHVITYGLLLSNYILDLTADNQRPPAELGYENGPWKGPRPPLLVAADLVKITPGLTPRYDGGAG